jgi:hypothetical protein
MNEQKLLSQYVKDLKNHYPITSTHSTMSWLLLMLWSRTTSAAHQLHLLSLLHTLS